MVIYPNLDPDDEEEQGLYPKISVETSKKQVTGMGPFRCFAYHRTHPQGKIFTDEVEYNEALQKGWKQAPWLIHEEELTTGPKLKPRLARKRKVGRPKKVK